LARITTSQLCNANLVFSQALILPPWLATLCCCLQELPVDPPVLDKPELLRFVKKKAQLKVRPGRWGAMREAGSGGSDVNGLLGVVSLTS
jgi:hypothetical protein